jgi:hypothetical protein
MLSVDHEKLLHAFSNKKGEKSWNTYTLLFSFLAKCNLLCLHLEIFLLLSSATLLVIMWINALDI